LAAASVALAALAAQSAHAVTVAFPAAGASWFSATDGSGTIPAGGQTGFMWTTGDYVVQTFAGTGLTSVDSISADWVYEDLLGGGGNDETVYVLVNSIAVAQFTALDCNYCGSYLTVGGTVNFAPIAGAGTYTIELQLQNTIPGGGGSIAFADGGLTTLTGSSAPEPAAWAMMLAGFGLAGVALRRRRLIAGA
jgi:hypothetical protein